MKKLALLFFLTFSLSLTAQNEKLVGKWTGESKGEVGSIIFDSEGFITFIIGGETMGGKEFNAGNEMASMTYSVDYSVEPYPIEMTITGKTSGQEAKMYGFIQFLTDDSIKMATGNIGQKITAITEENSIVLTKEK